VRALLSAFLLAASACGQSPCQDLDDRCADCTKEGKDHVEACKQAATLLSDNACEQVVKAVLPGKCPSPQDFLTLFPGAPGT
jgi:hypothetical protein